MITKSTFFSEKKGNDVEVAQCPFDTDNDTFLLNDSLIIECGTIKKKVSTSSKF